MPFLRHSTSADLPSRSDPAGRLRGPAPAAEPARQVLARAASAVLDWLLPSPCLACGAQPVNAFALCAPCFAGIRFLDRRSCRSCALRATEPGETCGACRARPPLWSRLFTLALYQPPFDLLLKQLKHRGSHRLAQPLIEACVDRFADEIASYDVAVPVPLHTWRHLQRGFNQSELLATGIARKVGLEVRQPLAKRAGPALSTLEPLARRRSARQTLYLRPKRGAVVLRAAQLLTRLPKGPRTPSATRHRSKASRTSSTDLRGRRVLLVDDVLTTGATAERATRLLRRCGASDVGVLAIARTPAPN